MVEAGRRGSITTPGTAVEGVVRRLLFLALASCSARDKDALAEESFVVAGSIDP